MEFQLFKKANAVCPKRNQRIRSMGEILPWPETFHVFFLWWNRWWFQTFFYFHPYLGKISNLTNIFQMGWNHQPVKLCRRFAGKNLEACLTGWKAYQLLLGQLDGWWPLKSDVLFFLRNKNQGVTTAPFDQPLHLINLGSLNYAFWRYQTIQMYGKFEGLTPCNLTNWYQKLPFSKGPVTFSKAHHFNGPVTRR